jgi:hypothetical protein
MSFGGLALVSMKIEEAGCAWQQSTANPDAFTVGVASGSVAR